MAVEINVEPTTSARNTNGKTNGGRDAGSDLGSLGHRVLRVDKPAGCTSHDVVADVRRWAGIRRVGHAGTLDPFATGLLLILVGRGTKLFPMLSGTDKEYEGVIRLGIETETGDPTGEVTARGDATSVSRDALDAAVAGFVGDLEQTPPMTSAIKHRGQPLYKLNRKGIEVERKPRRVRVDTFEVLGVDGADVAFRVRCSKGTYIRTLAMDVGRELGVGGHLDSLQRTAVGGCRLEGAAPLTALLDTEPREGLRTYGVSLADALDAYDAVRLTPVGVRKVRCGTYPTPADILDFDALEGVLERARLDAGSLGEEAGGEGRMVRLLDPSGELVAMARTGPTDDTATAASRLELVRVI